MTDSVLSMGRPVDDPFLSDVFASLSQDVKTLPCKYFYDHQGSKLFDRICDCKDYYITRTEMRLLMDIAPQIAKILGKKGALIEPGAGAIRKLSVLLKKIDSLSVYIPLDISDLFLKEAAQRIQKNFPAINIHPIAADFIEPFSVEHVITQYDVARILVFFPGSTFGNFAPQEGQRFLENMRKISTLTGGGMLIGVDLVKNIARLERAYNDSEGITAAFNKNILRRINRELGGRFNLEQFSHKAFFNKEKSRIEMHLVSQKKQSVPIGDKEISFEKGESIHTENSYKYTRGSFACLADKANFPVTHYWTDPEKLISLQYLET